MTRPEISSEAFISGTVLCVDKPLLWTSFDIVKKLKRAIENQCKIKKLKVGHAGTLDPLADGLLIVCTGKKTKEISLIQDMEKTYSGTFVLGATTPSYDLETAIDQTFDISGITNEEIVAAAKKLTGEYEQMPPLFSAKKIDGQRAYDIARAGKTAELRPKLVKVSSFEITNIDLPKIQFRVSCSKGTYIRSMAHDLGKLLNSGAHLAQLRRESIGSYNVNSALTMDGWLDAISHIQ
jgi:tRNA pseudouridine55 synthase